MLGGDVDQRGIRGGDVRRRAGWQVIGSNCPRSAGLLGLPGVRRLGQRRCPRGAGEMQDELLPRCVGERHLRKWQPLTGPGSRKDPQRTVEHAGGLVVSGQPHPLLHGVRVAVRSPPSTERHQQPGHQQAPTKQRAVVVLIPFSRCWSRRAGLRDEPGFVRSCRTRCGTHVLTRRSRLSGHGGRRRNRFDHRDAGPGGVGRHGEDPARVNQIGIHQAAPVGLNPITVELEDLLVAQWVSERALGNVPEAVVPAALGRLHLVELLRRGRG